MNVKHISFQILGFVAVIALFLSVRAVFAQNATADVTFNPSQVSVGSDNTGEVVVQISGDQGVSAFTITLNADEADFTAINDTFQVSGGNADASDFAEVSAFISDDNKTAKISYATTTLDDADLPTQASISVQAEKISSADGTITVDVTQGEVTGGEGVTYRVNATNEATLTGTGGGGGTDQATLRFSPEAEQGETGQSFNPVIIISAQDGIAGFNVIVEAENGIVEEIGEEIRVSGGSASDNDFSKDLAFISDDGKTARVAYTNSSLTADELPTEIRTTVQFKRTGTEDQDGIMSFSSSADVEVVGAESGYNITRGSSYRVSSSPVPSVTGSQQVSPTPGSGTSVTPTPGSGSSDCRPYWNIGDANCSGPKPDDRDFTLWEIFFVAEGKNVDGLGSVCTEGNINADFIDDDTVDLADFEVWRRGLFGTVTNPEKTWPERCL
jgi:hypothetical protein